jgi:hypothetical protein
MKQYLMAVSFSLIGLGITFSIIDFLIDNSIVVLVSGFILLGISYFLKN